MDEYADFLYWDNGRNAVRRVRAPASRPTWIPAPGAAAPVAATPAPAPVTYAPPAPVFNPVSAPVYATPQYGGMFPPYGPGYGYGPGAVFQNFLNSWTLGDFLQVGSEVMAALRELPTAPTPTGDVATDLANTITHQKLLAQHAKEVERILAVGRIGGRLGR